jgi:hypothetical protein
MAQTLEDAMQWTEQEIQALKAQEAKDLAVRLWHQLHAKAQGPLSPAEVQVQELQYELRLKEAECEDRRQQEAHLERVRDLELQIEREKARHAEALRRAEEVRGEHARLLDRVHEAEESLSMQLQRSTREHRRKIEQLEAEFTARSDACEQEIGNLREQRERLRQEIAELTGLREVAETVDRLCAEVESRRAAREKDQRHYEEEDAAARFEKTRAINRTKREQELELASLEAAHRKHVLELNRAAAEEILQGIGMVAVDRGQWDALREASQRRQELDDQQLAQLRQQAQDELRRAYNITSAEAFDVTQLYYQHQSALAEVGALRAQVEKLEAEIRRMREHVENEPQRIAAAVEAAKVHVQNTIEQRGT